MTLLLLSTPLEADAAPVGAPVPVRAADDAVPTPSAATALSAVVVAPVVRWRAPGGGAAAVADAPATRPRAQQTARSVVEAPPLVVDRGEYGGGWGAPQPQYAARQEVVIVGVVVPPRT